jgi:hypothetical protein
MQQSYLIAMLILSTTIPGMLVGNTFVYSANSQNSTDPKSQACYNAGFTVGRQNNQYNQSIVKQCGNSGKAYQEGFLSGCITGQGRDYFSCQRLTNSATDADTGGSGSADISGGNGGGGDISGGNGGGGDISGGSGGGGFGGSGGGGFGGRG